MRRLASLSTLGAGALGLGAGVADASSIVYSGVVDEQVGFSPGFHGRATIAGPDRAAGLLQALIRTTSRATTNEVHLEAVPGKHGTVLRFLAATYPVHQGSFARAFPDGAEWGSAGCNRHHCGTLTQGDVAFVVDYSSTKFTFFNSTDRYLLFQFTGGNLSQAIDGWAQLEVTFRQRSPDLTLIDFAYDTSGAQIPAGDTGTPEPSTFALTGLAALALGAKGLRAWRVARNAA